MAATTPTGSTVTRKELRRALSKYRRGEASKTQIERDLGVLNAHGKWISRNWASELSEFTGNSAV